MTFLRMYNALEIHLFILIMILTIVFHALTFKKIPPNKQIHEIFLLPCLTITSGFFYLVEAIIKKKLIQAKFYTPIQFLTIIILSIQIKNRKMINLGYNIISILLQIFDYIAFCFFYFRWSKSQTWLLNKNNISVKAKDTYTLYITCISVIKLNILLTIPIIIFPRVNIPFDNTLKALNFIVTIASIFSSMVEFYHRDHMKIKQILIYSLKFAITTLILILMSFYVDLLPLESYVCVCFCLLGDLLAIIYLIKWSKSYKIFRMYRRIVDLQKNAISIN
ncbi:hypothetical protein EDEG_01134 [Edhazardia aedis USNM 41457]|uniref:Uncharacterized protein n=1 Tax=Edhazardia aedis (strain USNM 41457) TaxID=1003232 RepID=J9DQ39_EDHAE|nr:hypothetical protein EDEG_01134 [Edhazardia aedis USNM 41457]|eukprot:EJW04665.1 hypothetical protein EDEG_01134 [Edhazardia aedis USNM 41457]